MSRNLALCIVLPLYLTLPLAATAQTPDARIDELTKEVEQLKATIADQGRRISDLQAAVKALQAVAPPLPAAIPSPTPLWQKPSSWNQIKKGMSEEQVVDILGPPTSVDAAIDVRTLYYQPDSGSTSKLHGSVTLTDDRVTAATPPAF